MEKGTNSNFGISVLYVASILPFWLLYVISDIIYFPLYYIWRYRRTIVRKNLTQAFPEFGLKEIVSLEKKYYRYLGDVILETAKLRTISKETFVKRFKITNIEILNELVDKGDHILVSAGHFYNWEWIPSAIQSMLNAQVLVIYKPVNDLKFDAFLTKLRSRLGPIMISMRQTLRAVLRHKDQPTVFCFASDQSPAAHEAHYWLNFLNQPTAVLTGLEKIARQTNRPVFYGHIRRLKKRGYYEMDMMPITTDPSTTAEYEITNQYFEHLEKSIRSAPAYWF